MLKINCQLTCKSLFSKTKHCISTNLTVKTFDILQLLLLNKVAVQILLLKILECDKLKCRPTTPTQKWMHWISDNLLLLLMYAF